jgi:predicted helicase
MINMQEMNKALCIGRQWSSVGSSQFDVVFASEHIVDFNLFRRGGENLFPLYILTNGEEKMFFGIKEPEIEYEGFTKKGLHKTDNFTKEFRQFIKTKYKESYSPEHILGYIYSVLHSPAYRSNYIEFLKNDFPKVPFTKNEDVFQKLSVIGIELFETHLMNKIPEIIDCQSAGSGDNFRVELINYKSNKVWFNNDRYIDNIPPGVWDFHIGGYQVLDKWLKERKKHNIILSKSDMDHFKAIVNILAFTIDTMHKIDDLSSDWI